MSSPHALQRRPIQDVVTIGQVWQHHGPEFAIRIKQIHRADRLVEAWFPGPQGRVARSVPFADLQREYDPVE